MTQPRSVARRLRRDLGAVTLIGGILLLGAVVFLYWRWISSLPPEQARTRAVYELFEHVILPLLVLMLPVVWVGQRVIRMAFAPLEDATAEIGKLDGNERGYRIPTDEMPAEALPFVDAVNDLLGKVDGAARQQEAFAGDVAHELRTPLATLALELDSLEHPDASRLRTDVAAMQRLIDQLLLLAQAEAANSTGAALRAVPLAAVARDVVTRIAPAVIASDRQIAFEDAGDAATVLGRSEAIAAALRNLVENAVRVTPPGGMILVTAGPGAVLGVQDSGPGLTVERLHDLVRRHHRADHASHAGAGLGLAIVARIMAAHHGKLETDPEERRLLLRFPTI